MAIRALNPFAPQWYTPRADKDAELPTKFKLRGLDGNEQGYIAPELQLDHESKMVSGMTGKGLEISLRHGLLDWENFSNDSGPVAFSPRNFGLLPYEIRVELAMQILGLSYVAEPEKKTS